MQQQCNILLTKLQTHESYLYVFYELFVLTCEPVPLKDSTSLAGKKNKKTPPGAEWGLGAELLRSFLSIMCYIIIFHRRAGQKR